MKKVKLILHICNLAYGLLMIVFAVKFSGLFSFLRPVSIFHIIIAVIVVYGLKSWIEIKYDIADPLKTNKLTAKLFNIGNGIVIIGVLIKVMHWSPLLSTVLIIIGALAIVSSYILSFVLDADTSEPDSEILDDFTS